MYKINAVNKLNENELKYGDLSGDGSWHRRYKGSSYIYIGGLLHAMTEGDILVVFSQWGEPVDINLIRDKKTGKSKGYAFLAYEDQRSTIVAVDNANGMELLGRRISVDHVLNYRAPERYYKCEDGSKELLPYQATGAEGWGIGVSGVVESERNRHGCGGEYYANKKSKSKSEASAASGKEASDADEIWARQFEQLLKAEKKKEKDGLDSDTE